jgi:hypothetical protein
MNSDTVLRDHLVKLLSSRQAQVDINHTAGDHARRGPQRVSPRPVGRGSASPGCLAGLRGLFDGAGFF